MHQPGDIVKVGASLLQIEVEGVPEVASTPSPTPISTLKSSRDVEPTKKVLASPAVRLLAKTSGIYLSKVTPTGPDDRITREDVLRHKENLESSRLSEEAAAKVERIQLRGLRKAMVKSMNSSLSIPHFHFSDEVDMTSILSVKTSLAEEPLCRGFKFTFLPILVKSLSLALLEYPQINSSLSEEQTEIIIHPSHNIGIAMATEYGLSVPNVKRVEEKSIIQIAREIEELRKDAWYNSLRQQDLTGTTISVSNIGTIGGIHATPLITPPQVAIVALGKLRSVLVPCPSEGYKQKPMMPISWGADHRVVDGATMVEFSNRWKRLIECPGLLLGYLK